MKYVQIIKDDYDKSLKLNGKLCFCYSAKKFKEIEDKDVEILGEVLKGETEKESETKLSVNDKLIPVFENGTFKKHLYKKTAYIAVEESDGYIAVMESKAPMLLWLLALLVIAVVAVMLLLNTKPKTETIEPYNALPPIDSNVEMMDEEKTTEDDITIPEGGGRVGIGYKEIARLNLSTKEITMEYSNSGSSNQDALLELYVLSGEDEYLVASSGRIPAGQKLTRVFLMNGAPQLSNGAYDALYRVYYYDANSGEKSLVFSDIRGITLIVKDK